MIYFRVLLVVVKNLKFLFGYETKINTSLVKGVEKIKLEKFFR